MKINNTIYSARMTGNQFLYHEFKVMCDLVLQGFNKKEATQKIIDENLFDYRSMKAINKHTYTNVPYGWSEYDIAGLIVDLLKTNDIAVVYNGANIDLKHTNLVRYLTNEREFLSTTIKIKEKIDIAKIQSVCDFAKDLFETQSFNGSDGEELAKQLKSAIDEKVSELKDILIHYTNDKYPQKSLIETGIDKFKLLSSEPDTNTLFDKLLSNRDEIKEWNTKGTLNVFNRRRI